MTDGIGAAHPPTSKLSYRWDLGAMTPSCNGVWNQVWESSEARGWHSLRLPMASNKATPLSLKERSRLLASPTLLPDDPLHLQPFVP